MQTMQSYGLCFLSSISNSRDRFMVVEQALDGELAGYGGVGKTARGLQPLPRKIDIPKPAQTPVMRYLLVVGRERETHIRPLVGVAETVVGSRGAHIYDSQAASKLGESACETFCHRLRTAF